MMYSGREITHAIVTVVVFSVILGVAVGFGIAKWIF